MCSIFGIFNPAVSEQEARHIAVEQSNLMIHRGPDSHGVFSCPSGVLVHNRISIVDVFTGGQPLYSQDQSVALVANGEIYNHHEIRQSLRSTPSPQRRTARPFWQRTWKKVWHACNGCGACLPLPFWISAPGLT